MPRFFMSASTLALAFVALPTGVAAQTDTATEEDVVVVKMVDKSATEFAFEPATVTVSPGQTIRFVQEGVQPHNVEFRDPPPEASLDDVLMGPFLVQRGQTYEVIVDDRFIEGSYPYVCTPHEAMGMKGTIVVEVPSGPDR